MASVVIADTELIVESDEELVESLYAEATRLRSAVAVDAYAKAGLSFLVTSSVYSCLYSSSY